MLERQRQQLILDFLKQKRFASVRTLCAKLNTSEATIRRDLLKMAKNKNIKKIRGGAEYLPSPAAGQALRFDLEGTSFDSEKNNRSNIKRLIAKKAVELCEDGDSIIINGGSSTYMMSEFLAKRELSIFTNSFVLAQMLFTNCNNQVTLPGGELYRKQGIILSAFDKDSTQNYHGSKMFMGTPGIGDYGVMESDPLLIRTEQKLRKQADQLIILADSSKIGKRSNFIFSTLSDVDVLITDSNADPKTLQHFEQQGIKIILADAEASEHNKLHDAVPS